MALTDWALRFILAALEESTQASQASALNAFHAFCDAYGVEPEERMPPSHSVLMAFATHLKQVRRVQSSTVRNYISGVRSLCVDAGASTESFYHPTLVRLLEGIRRIERDTDARERRPRLPITVSLLDRMIPTMGNSVKGAMLKAASSCGVYGLFRAGEITFKGVKYPILRRADVTWLDNAVKITLNNSKTDYLRRGVTVRLAANGSTSCPIKLLRDAWDRAPNQCPDAAVFQDHRGAPLRYKSLLRAIRTAVADLGLTGTYGGHSLRAGGATTLALMGYPDSLIKILGRWKSLAYQRYIKLDPHTFRSVSVDMAKQGRVHEPFGGLPGRSPICQFLNNVDVSLRLSNH